MFLGMGAGHPPRHHLRGLSKRREPRVSAIISQAALFQRPFHLTGDLPSFKKGTFLNHGLETALWKPKHFH